MGRIGERARCEHVLGTTTLDQLAQLRLAGDDAVFLGDHPFQVQLQELAKGEASALRARPITHAPSHTPHPSHTHTITHAADLQTKVERVEARTQVDYLRLRARLLQEAERVTPYGCDTNIVACQRHTHA